MNCIFQEVPDFPSLPTPVILKVCSQMAGSLAPENLLEISEA